MVERDGRLSPTGRQHCNRRSCPPGLTLHGCGPVESRRDVEGHSAEACKPRHCSIQLNQPVLDIFYSLVATQQNFVNGPQNFTCRPESVRGTSDRGKHAADGCLSLRLLPRFRKCLQDCSTCLFDSRPNLVLHFVGRAVLVPPESERRWQWHCAIVH